MFCPGCKDEFRPGFTRCARCDVDLVESLSPEPQAAPEHDPEAPPAQVRMGEYCGFLSLEEARSARDKLRGHRIHGAILIRDQPDNTLDRPVREDYWLLIDVARAKEVARILGDVPQVEQKPQKPPEESDTEFACGECGQGVAAEEAFCPKCGARFDD